MKEIVRQDIMSIISSECIDWNLFENKTVLITGATGMLPSYMALTLMQLNISRNLNIKIILLVRNRNKAERVFSDFLPSSEIEILEQDVCKPIEYCGKINYIIHAASQASPKFYGTDPVGTALPNIIGTYNLLELAKAKQSEGFLFFSTSGVYGNLSSEDQSISEKMQGTIDPLHVRSSYFESKRMGENLCVDYHSQYGIPAKIIRIFHTLGPGIDVNDGRAFSDFCKSIIKNEDIVLKSDGSARRTFCYASDAVKAYFIVLLKGIPGEAYNVGSEKEEVDMATLANQLITSYPEKGLNVLFDINPDDVTYSKMKNPVNRIIPDTSKLIALGWQERFTYIDSFRRTIEALSK